MFWRALERCRFGLIPHLAQARRVLTIGEGDGRFVAELVRQMPHVQVDCVEGSAAMIARARARLPEGATVRFHHADALQWEYPDAAYDAVVTCFFLDCFTEDSLRQWMPQVVRALGPRGRWLVTEFRPAGPGLRGLWRRLLLATMYRFFGWTAGLQAQHLPDWAGVLGGLGCESVEDAANRGSLLESSVWQVVAEPLSAAVAVPAGRFEPV